MKCEISALVEVVIFDSNKETVRRFLIQANNKIGGYSNIPYALQQKYHQMIVDAELELKL